MPKKNGSDKGSPTLLEDVQHLITRKLRHRQREQQKQVVTANQTAYAKLRDEVLANIRIENYRNALTSVPLAIYKEIVANATAMTEEWPGIVWEVIESILSTAQVVPPDVSAINRIVDEFAWATGVNPFTLSYVDPERFEGVVRREASRYGINHQGDLVFFNSQMGLAAAAAQCGILNTARQAREGVGIAIDEYLLAQRNAKRHENGLSAIMALQKLLPAHIPKLKGKAKKRDRRPESADQIAGLEIGSPKWRKQTARKAANARHDKPGGSRDKQQQIREIWASGKYSSRDRCAEEECAALNMSYAAARKALRNTSSPIRT